jgi:hypothetical protein
MDRPSPGSCLALRPSRRAGRQFPAGGGAAGHGLKLSLSGSSPGGGLVRRLVPAAPFYNTIQVWSVKGGPRTVGEL